MLGIFTLDESQKIYIFGGDNGAVAEYDMMFFDDLRILDPTTWQWDAPNPQGVPPGRRSYASAAILDGQYMTIAFGMQALLLYHNKKREAHIHMHYRIYAERLVQ